MSERMTAEQEAILKSRAAEAKRWSDRNPKYNQHNKDLAEAIAAALAELEALRRVEMAASLVLSWWECHPFMETSNEMSELADALAAKGGSK